MNDIDKRAHDLALLYLSKTTKDMDIDPHMPISEHQDCFAAIYNDVYERFKDQILKDQWN